MDTLAYLEHQLPLLTTKVELLSERLYEATLKEQEALAALQHELTRTLGEVRNAHTSLEHLFGCLNEQVERNRYQVWGNPTGGLVDRVAKLEFEALRLGEQRKRNLAAIWTVIGGVLLYVATQLLGKLL
jgi:hypothetical protein